MIPKSQSQTCIFDRGKDELKNEKHLRSKSSTAVSSTEYRSFFVYKGEIQTHSFKTYDKEQRGKVVLCKNGVKKIIPKLLWNDGMKLQRSPSTEDNVNRENGGSLVSAVESTKTEDEPHPAKEPNSKWAWHKDTKYFDIHSVQPELTSTLDQRETSLTAERTDTARHYLQKRWTDDLYTQNAYSGVLWHRRKNFRYKQSFDTRLHFHKTSTSIQVNKESKSALRYELNRLHSLDLHNRNRFCANAEPVSVFCVTQSRYRSSNHRTSEPREKLSRKESFSAAESYPSFLTSKTASLSYSTGYNSVSRFTRHHDIKTYPSVSVRDPSYHFDKFHICYGTEICKERGKRDGDEKTIGSKFLNQNSSRVITDQETLSSSQCKGSKCTLSQVATAANKPDGSNDILNNNSRLEIELSSSYKSVLEETCVDTGQVEKSPTRAQRQIYRYAQTNTDISSSAMASTAGGDCYKHEPGSFRRSIYARNLPNRMVSILSEAGQFSYSLVPTSPTSNGKKWNLSSKSSQQLAAKHNGINHKAKGTLKLDTVPSRQPGAWVIKPPNKNVAVTLEPTESSASSSDSETRFGDDLETRSFEDTKKRSLAAENCFLRRAFSAGVSSVERSTEGATSEYSLPAGSATQELSSRKNKFREKVRRKSSAHARKYEPCYRRCPGWQSRIASKHKLEAEDKRRCAPCDEKGQDKGRGGGGACRDDAWKKEKQGKDTKSNTCRKEKQRKDTKCDTCRKEKQGKDTKCDTCRKEKQGRDTRRDKPCEHKEARESSTDQNESSCNTKQKEAGKPSSPSRKEEEGNVPDIPLEPEQQSPPKEMEKRKDANSKKEKEPAKKKEKEPPKKKESEKPHKAEEDKNSHKTQKEEKPQKVDREKKLPKIEKREKPQKPEREEKPRKFDQEEKPQKITTKDEVQVPQKREIEKPKEKEEPPRKQSEWWWWNKESPPKNDDKTEKSDNRQPEKPKPKPEPKKEASVKESPHKNSNVQISTNQNKKSQTQSSATSRTAGPEPPHPGERPPPRDDNGLAPIKPVQRQPRSSESSIYDAAVSFFKAWGMNYFAQALLDKMDSLKRGNRKLKFVAPPRRGLYVAPQPYPIWIYPKDPLGLYKYIAKIRGKPKTRGVVYAANEPGDNSCDTFVSSLRTLWRDKTSSTLPYICPGMRSSSYVTHGVSCNSTREASTNTPKDPQKSKRFFISAPFCNSIRSPRMIPSHSKSWFSRPSTPCSSYQCATLSSKSTKPSSTPKTLYLSQRVPRTKRSFQPQKSPCGNKSFLSPCGNKSFLSPSVPCKCQKVRKLSPPCDFKHCSPPSSKYRENFTVLSERSPARRCPHCRQPLHGSSFAPFIPYTGSSPKYAPRELVPDKKVTTVGTQASAADSSEPKSKYRYLFEPPRLNLEHSTSKSRQSNKSPRSKRPRHSSREKHSSHPTNKASKSASAFTSHISAIYLNMKGRRKRRKRKRKKKQKGVGRIDDAPDIIAKSSKKLGEQNEVVPVRDTIRSSLVPTKSGSSRGSFYRKGGISKPAPSPAEEKQAEESKTLLGEGTETIPASQAKSLLLPDRRLNTYNKRSSSASRHRMPERQCSSLAILKSLDDHIGIRSLSSHRRHRSSNGSSRRSSAPLSKSSKGSHLSTQAIPKHSSADIIKQPLPQNSSLLSNRKSVSNERAKKLRSQRDRRGSERLSFSGKSKHTKDVGFNKFFQETKKLTRLSPVGASTHNYALVQPQSDEVAGRVKFKKRRSTFHTQNQKKPTEKTPEKLVSKCRPKQKLCQQTEKMQQALFRVISANSLKGNFDESYRVVWSAPPQKVSVDTDSSCEESISDIYGSCVDRKTKTAKTGLALQHINNTVGDSLETATSASQLPGSGNEQTKEENPVTVETDAKKKADHTRFSTTDKSDTVSYQVKDWTSVYSEHKVQGDQDTLSFDSTTKQTHDKDTFTASSLSIKEENEVGLATETKSYQEQNRASLVTDYPNVRDRVVTSFSSKPRSTMDKNDVKIIAEENKSHRYNSQRGFENKPNREKDKSPCRTKENRIPRSRSTSPKSTKTALYDSLTPLSSRISLKQRPFKLHSAFYSDKSVLKLSPATFPTVGSSGYFSCRRYRQTIDTGPVDAFRLRSVTIGKYGAGCSSYSTPLTPSRFTPASSYLLNKYSQPSTISKYSRLTVTRPQYSSSTRWAYRS